MRRLGILVAGLLWAGSTGAEEPAAAVRFELSFPEGVRSQPADGRLFVVISKEGDPEPRLQFGKEGDQYRSTPFFGQDVEGLKPGQWAAVGGGALGYPIARLADIPPGDYFVQGMLNVYTTFHRADGHAVKLHADQWEGQVFQISPGNLYSEVRRMRLDPRRGETVRLTLGKKIPPVEIPADSRYVKRVRFQSALLSKFWGQPIFVGATVLLPRDYEKEKEVFYPVNYEQGHFATGPPGGFGEKVEVPAGATERQKARARAREEFTRAWLSDGFPRMLFVTFQHPTPYYDDSYAVDSPNNGPYGQVMMTELIPYIETHFRAIREPWARLLSGGSTGGWESLALQVFHPDDFGGTFSACPDPVDFHSMQIVNIYDWDNAWHKDTGFLRVPLPGERDTEGVVRSTMEQQLKYERALGPGGRSGEDWDCWQAVYGPIGKDGYFQPLFDPETGAIDKSVAAYWREHSDLTAYLQKHWSEIGGKLAGKIHITAGEMDTYYLNNAVHRLDDFLRTTTNPPWGGTILYGPRKPHCWAGPLSQVERIKLMAQYAAEHAPKNSDPAWWRD
ncbi:MAG TPA: alpha/beta hydrolase-fold protein [Thermoanaerobaculia bacterium]|nr:alpha/beta hydrolase-fold protein [Thermoanaerobaculia bacterium]